MTTTIQYMQYVGPVTEPEVLVVLIPAYDLKLGPP